MAESSWLQFSVFLCVALQVTVTAQFSPRLVVREGEEVALPCGVGDGGCGSIDWLFSRSAAGAVLLVQQGQIPLGADRLRVAAHCSLVIKAVGAEDDGFYTCRGYRSSYTSDAHVNLFVINMREDEDSEQVTLSCSVLRYQCQHTLKWTYEDVDEDKVKTSTANCFATVRFPVHLKQAYSDAFKCEVTDTYTEKVSLFAFRPQASGEDATPTINRTVPAIHETPTTLMRWWWWWLYVVAAVGSAALIITVVVFVKVKRSKGNKMQTEEEAGQILNSVLTPETGRNPADTEDAVYYASIRYTKKTDTVVNDDDDGGAEGDAVIYSAVKTSSAPAGVSADLCDLYATIHKQKR
ncbi:uncharacterized protein LOC114428400 isoform X2 [Parambassis ranga]|uniref:Uncharacterized protein LOC114428400 isoform X2 n=1 Tax=Parambassis ranga TaxID=210632 RepID=A0A6P7HPQ2_9TELE|nr:uncharacterized protein LOC114428400 isoform X2 [Parambassis ranga]